VVLYGRPRLTADLDVTIEADPSRLGEVVAALAAAGLEPRADDLDQLVARTRVLPLHHRESGLPVDVVLAGPGLEAEFLANARIVDVSGVAVPFIAPEDLLVTKILAGRAKDIEDARGVLAERGDTLDLARTRRFLGLLEAALGRSDLVRELERLIGKA
jgi:hypothetical protein